MKKIAFSFFIIILFSITGCTSNMTEPTTVVENYFSSYQNLDKHIINKIDETIADKEELTKEQKEMYKDIIERQFQNLSYKITNEEVYKTKAVVEVEIEVLDYHTSLLKSKEYYENNKNKLKTQKQYNDYKLKKLKTVQEKRKYDLIINLTKNENIWTIDEPSNIDKEKLYGLY